MRLLLPILAALAVFASISDDAQAGPLCSDMAVFPVPLGSFESCVVEGAQDSLANVQAALDLALVVDIVLDGTGSFCPGPACSGSEFLGSDPGSGFEIDPESLAGSTGFTFEQLPPGTMFVTLKQQNDFEVFRVPSGGVPFDLTHQLAGDDTSHISTFAAVPEPATALLLAGGLLGLGLRSRRAR